MLFIHYFIFIDIYIINRVKLKLSNIPSFYYFWFSKHQKVLILVSACWAFIAWQETLSVTLIREKKRNKTYQHPTIVKTTSFAFALLGMPFTKEQREETFWAEYFIFFCNLFFKKFWSVSTKFLSFDMQVYFVLQITTAIHSLLLQVNSFTQLQHYASFIPVLTTEALILILQLARKYSLSSVKSLRNNGIIYM